MRYIDSGNRDAVEALGSWFQEQLTLEVSSLRFQSGFFGADGLSSLAETLSRLADSDLPVNAVIGANNGATLASHVTILVSLLGILRPMPHSDRSAL